jgi:PhnB protein
VNPSSHLPHPHGNCGVEQTPFIGNIMKEILAYLNFDGNCRQAMEFYSKCLGGELYVMTFAESKMKTPPGAEDRLAHARVKSGTAVLMASDLPPGMTHKPGSNIALSLNCDSAEEAERVFAALSEGGKITMPIQQTFWALRFGGFTDQFGINWMINYYDPNSQYGQK